MSDCVEKCVGSSDQLVSLCVCIWGYVRTGVVVKRVVC